MGSRLHIVRILTRLNIGGPAIHASLLSTRLPAERFSTCLVVGEPDASEGDLSGLIQGEPVRLIRLKTLRRSLNPWADLQTFRRLVRIVWTEQPRILHTHMAKAGALGRLAGSLYNRIGPGRDAARRLVLIHTFHGHVLEGYFSPWLTRVFVIIERVLARRTDCLIAVSERIRQDLLALGIGRPEQWRVVPLGIDLSALKALPPPNGSPSVRCGMVGRLVPIKNPSLFLQALRRVNDAAGGRDVAGVLVGDGPLRQGLEREAEQLGLQGVIRFAGWQRDLARVYEALDIVCLTSWNEGTPVALIEAMAAGRAVIATDVGGVRDVLEAGEPSAEPVPEGTFRLTTRGLLIRPGDVEGLSAALAALIQDAALRRRLGEAGRAGVVERFAPERLVQDMTSLYESFAEGEPRNA